MSKTYKVTYKSSPSQIVTGNIVLFGNEHTTISNVRDAVYLNAKEVISVVEQKEEVKLLVDGEAVNFGKVGLDAGLE